ncbi:hypothetical protein E2C01_058853 [Portunus trituberculatus]|uniref:Uncharacterized protein n=1 Tax=Portunus trituberculatus TaxID=210409 RepID=A0A5B7H3V3_PORTR|nr:hypothetical protein [Portunus trituberculatus]
MYQSIKITSLSPSPGAERSAPGFTGTRQAERCRLTSHHPRGEIRPKPVSQWRKVCSRQATYHTPNLD